MTTISDVNDDAMWDVFNRFHYLCDTHRFQKLLARADLIKEVIREAINLINSGVDKEEVIDFLSENFSVNIENEKT